MTKSEPITYNEFFNIDMKKVKKEVVQIKAEYSDHI